MNEPKYRRVLLKISGEALAGDAHRGLNFDVIGSVCDVVKQCVEAGVQVGIVVGGGNFWRGIKDGGDRMERTRADQMGMLATVINCLALADSLEQRGVEVRVQTAIEMTRIAEPYIRGRAIRHLEKGRVVIFGCGTGNPLVYEIDPSIRIFYCAGAVLGQEAQKIGLKTAAEIFADRAYMEDLSLVPRKQPGSMITDEDLAVERCIKMIKEHKVTAITGKEVAIQGDTLCVHGDGAKALAFVERIRKEFEAEGIQIRNFQ